MESTPTAAAAGDQQPVVTTALAAQKSTQQSATPQQIQQVPAASSSSSNTASLPQYHVNPYGAMAQPGVPGSKYQHLLAFIEELGKDIRPTYNASRICQERLKRGIGQARLMLRECMTELEQNRKQAGAGGGQ